MAISIQDFLKGLEPEGGFKDASPRSGQADNTDELAKLLMEYLYETSGENVDNAWSNNVPGKGWSEEDSFRKGLQGGGPSGFEDGGGRQNNYYQDYGNAVRELLAQRLGGATSPSAPLREGVRKAAVGEPRGEGLLYEALKNMLAPKPTNKKSGGAPRTQAV